MVASWVATSSRGSETPKRVRVRADNVLLRDDRNPNTQGCLDHVLGRTGVAEILKACRDGKVRALVLQGPELLRQADAVSALAQVPFIAVMTIHEGTELERAHVVLRAAVWAEGDWTFTNYARRIQRLRRAVPAPGEATAMWELAAGLLERLGQPLGATSRVKCSRCSPPVFRMAPPGFNATLHNTHNTVGGDYWRFARGMNASGNWWIGSGDVRRLAIFAPGKRIEELANGVLISPSCTLHSDYVSFRIGGTRGTSQRVELQVQDLGGFPQPRDYQGLSGPAFSLYGQDVDRPYHHTGTRFFD
jgi:Molybdopterin oxidoreductase